MIQHQVNIQADIDFQGRTNPSRKVQNLTQGRIKDEGAKININRNGRLKEWKRMVAR